MLAHIGQASAIGSAATVRSAITAFVERTGADELIFGGSTYDPADRIRALEIAAECVAA